MSFPIISLYGVKILALWFLGSHTWSKLHHWLSRGFGLQVADGGILSLHNCEPSAQNITNLKSLYKTYNITYNI